MNFLQSHFARHSNHFILRSEDLLTLPHLYMLITTEPVLPANLRRVNVSQQVSRRKVFLSLLLFVQHPYHPEEEEVWKPTAVLVLRVSIAISGVKRI